ncbi:MAG: type II toxin-antitoxin system RelE/ParE family toxin [Verrucomicrobiota bacterium]
MKLVFSSVFECDFAELAGYFFEQAGTGVSRQFEDSISRLAKLLLRNPELGRARRDLKPEGIRSLPIPDFRNYLLFYRVDGNSLVLLRVRFAGMDLPALFQS